jgi:hypothetical protein
MDRKAIAQTTIADTVMAPREVVREEAPLPEHVRA